MADKERDRFRDQREVEPRDGESPGTPPREEQPTGDEAEITPEPWSQVPDRDGQGGVAWEELRKGMSPSTPESLDEAAFDDHETSERMAIDGPEPSWEQAENTKKSDASS